MTHAHTLQWPFSRFDGLTDKFSKVPEEIFGDCWQLAYAHSTIAICSGLLAVDRMIGNLLSYESDILPLDQCVPTQYTDLYVIHRPTVRYTCTQTNDSLLIKIYIYGPQ